MRGKTIAKSILAVCAALLTLLAIAGCHRAPGGTRTPGGSQPATPAPSPAPSDGFELYFVDVGKGDCALMRLPGGKWAMVDTGPANGLAAVGGLLRTLGVTSLEAVFISHPHSDHVGNLEAVLAYASCGAVYTTPADFGKATAGVMETAGAFGVPVSTLSPGQAVALSGVMFTALGPNGSFAEENDDSLVLLAEYRGFKALFAGDQLQEAEAALLANGRSPDCDVLKVGHHGQSDASSEAFIRAASPKVCVIPTSGEPGDRPGDDVLERLQASGAETYVVGLTGTLRCSAADLRMEAVTPSGPPPGLELAAVDAEAEYVEIANPTGSAADLTGWSVLSDKGNQLYFFPDGFTLQSGESVRVYSGMERAQAPGGLFWTEKKIWKDKKADGAALLDPYARVAAERR